MTAAEAAAEEKARALSASKAAVLRIVLEIVLGVDIWDTLDPSPEGTNFYIGRTFRGERKC